MKKSLLLSLFLAVFGAFAVLAQPSTRQLPGGFFYDKRDELIFQVGPDSASALKAAAADDGFTAVTLTAGMGEFIFYLGIYRISKDGSKPSFKESINLPVQITADGETFTLGEERYIRTRKPGKAKIEILLVGISSKEFGRIISARQVDVEFGKLSYLLSAENLQAFRHLRNELEADPVLKSDVLIIPPDPSGKRIKLNGFYDTDGYYIRGWMRGIL